MIYYTKMKLSSRHQITTYFNVNKHRRQRARRRLRRRNKMLRRMRLEGYKENLQYKKNQETI